MHPCSSVPWWRQCLLTGSHQPAYHLWHLRKQNQCKPPNPAVEHLYERGERGEGRGEGGRKRERGGGREGGILSYMHCTPSREGCFAIEGPQFLLYNIPRIQLLNYLSLSLILGLGCEDNGAGHGADWPCWNHLLPSGAGWTQPGRSTPLQRLLR